MLDALAELPAGAVSDEVARLAWRFAYGFFLRHPVDFPLVQMQSAVAGTPRWGDPAELAPGSDAGLDRAVRIILEGEPVCAPPDAEALARDRVAEDARFGTPPGTGLTAVAYAEELIADTALLRAWARAFPTAEGMTLVIDTPPDATEALIAAVSSLGLAAGHGPDLVAADLSGSAPASVDAVFSRLPRELAAPRYDETGLDALRALAL
jgi:hypothetical protein